MTFHPETNKTWIIVDVLCVLLNTYRLEHKKTSYSERKHRSYLQ